MEFDLDKFVADPTLHQLNTCKKVDLLQIASVFEVQVPVNVKKEELRLLLIERLGERGLFASPSIERVGKADAELQGPAIPTPANPALKLGMSAEELQLTLRIREMEYKNRELEVQAMQLRLRALELERYPNVAPQLPAVQQTPYSPRDGFDVGKHIALVPPFRESEVDSYFSALERIATLHWPRDVWTLLLQCKFMGKAQEVCATLTVEQKFGL